MRPGPRDVVLALALTILLVGLVAALVSVALQASA